MLTTKKTVIPALLLGIQSCRDMRSEINETVKKKKGNDGTEVLETTLKQYFRLGVYTYSSTDRFNTLLLRTHPVSGRGEIPAGGHPNEWE